MAPKLDILVADDEPSIRKGCKALLEGAGYSVRTARNGAETLKKYSEKRPDLVLLDVMMPGMNGKAACAELRKLDPMLPILLFTAMPSDVGAVDAFGFGADDYIDKAKSPEEILARIAAALRRLSAMSAARDAIPLGSTVVHLDKMTAEGPDGEHPLTKVEVSMLRLLSSERGRVFTYDEIMSAMHYPGYVGEDGAVHVAVHRLKQKLGPSGALITPERGVGYRLVP